MSLFLSPHYVFTYSLLRAMDFFSDFVDSLHGSDFIGGDAEELFEAITHFSTDYDCLTQAQLQNLMELVCVPSTSSFPPFLSLSLYTTLFCLLISHKIEAEGARTC